MISDGDKNAAEMESNDTSAISVFGLRETTLAAAAAGDMRGRDVA